MSAVNDGNGGYVGPGDIATLSLLGRGFSYGHGYGYGGSHGHVRDSVLAADAHADGSAVAAKVDAVGEKTDAQTNMFDAAERSRQFEATAALLAEGRLAAQASMNALNQRVSDVAADAAKCCCDAQLQAERNAASLRAEILAVESRTITRELERCERRLEGADTANTIVAALQEQTKVLTAMLAQRV